MKLKAAISTTGTEVREQKFVVLTKAHWKRNLRAQKKFDTNLKTSIAFATQTLFVPPKKKIKQIIVTNP